MSTSYGPPSPVPWSEFYAKRNGETPLNPRIKHHQEWMETESKFAHACPDLDDGMEPQDPCLLPCDALNRKQVPMARGLLDYFPKALAEVAHCSFVGNEQHHPGTPLHWDHSKSTDEADALVRHLVDRGKYDKDGIRHSAKVAWRALAMLERELNGEKV